MTDNSIMNYVRLSQYNSIRDAFIAASRLRDILRRYSPVLAEQAEQIMECIKPQLHDARNAVIRQEVDYVVQDEPRVTE